MIGIITILWRFNIRFMTHSKPDTYALFYDRLRQGRR